MVLTLGIVFAVSPAHAQAHHDCFPMAKQLHELLEVEGGATEVVTIEEWSVCAGPGIGGTNPLSRPSGQSGLERVQSLVANFNAGPGLDYIIDLADGYPAIRPAADQGLPPITEFPVSVDSSTQRLVGEAENHIFDQLRANEGPKQPVFLGLTGRKAQPSATTFNDLPLGSALSRVHDDAFIESRSWLILVFPVDDEVFLSYEGFSRRVGQGNLVLKDGGGEDPTCSSSPCSNRKVNVCHKPGEPAENTLCISENAVPAHLGHGDVCGTCP